MHLRSFQITDHAVVEQLVAAREIADGLEALSEHKASRLGGGPSRGSVEFVVTDDGDQVIGYTQAAAHRGDDGSVGRVEIELVIHPMLDEQTTADVADTLLAAALTAPPVDVLHTLWAWRPVDVAAAQRAGLSKTRSLLEMDRPLPTERTWQVPDGVAIEPFRPGRDETAWLGVNRAAFEGHPENGSLELGDLEERMAKPWFDPQGLLMAWEDDRLLGFCWTKLHEGHRGEIYIVGVSPQAQGRGLGTVLVLAALDDLATRQGATEVHLYVEGENRPAVAFYEALGFTKRRELGEYAARKH